MPIGVSSSNAALCPLPSSPERLRDQPRCKFGKLSVVCPSKEPAPALVARCAEVRGVIIAALLGAVKALLQDLGSGDPMLSTFKYAPDSFRIILGSSSSSRFACIAAVKLPGPSA